MMSWFFHRVDVNDIRGPITERQRPLQQRCQRGVTTLTLESSLNHVREFYLEKFRGVNMDTSMLTFLDQLSP